MFLLRACLMVYLTMMSAPQTTHYQMVDWYIFSELERMWKEATMASLEVLFQRWPGETDAYGFQI
jgi:hypothetical protein